MASLDPTIIQRVTEGLESAFESGRLRGQEEERAAYYGKSARMLTGNIFAASLEATAQMLRPHDVEAADFFHTKASEFRAWITPPQVQTTTPADGATVSAGISTITAKFVAPGLDPDSVTGENVYVTLAGGGSPVPATVEYNLATATVTILLDAPLANGTAYKVVLGAGLRGAGGMSLGQDYAITFTTEPD